MSNMAYCIKDFGADKGPQGGANTIALADTAQRNLSIAVNSIQAAKPSGDVVTSTL